MLRYFTSKIAEDFIQMKTDKYFLNCSDLIEPNLFPDTKKNQNHSEAKFVCYFSKLYHYVYTYAQFILYVHTYYMIHWLISRIVNLST